MSREEQTLKEQASRLASLFQCRYVGPSPLIRKQISTFSALMLPKSRQAQLYVRPPFPQFLDFLKKLSATHTQE